MRSGLVLLLVTSFAFALDRSCEEQLLEQLDKDHKEDTDGHDCRACKMISVDAAASCPKQGFDCDESLSITTNVLRAGECDCVQLRCKDANATLAVRGAPVDKVRCKDRKWTTPSKSEAPAAVCARKCGLRVCEVLLSADLVGQDDVEPLIVTPPDDLHPCAWGECQYGAKASDGKNEVVFDGISSFSCSGAGTWRYTGPGEEKRQLRKVRCVKEPSKCAMCDDTLTNPPLNKFSNTIGPSPWFDVPSIDSDGCKVHTLVCPLKEIQYHAAADGHGTPLGTLEGEDGEFQMMVVRCSDTGKAWEYNGLAVRSVTCINK